MFGLKVPKRLHHRPNTHIPLNTTPIQNYSCYGIQVLRIVTDTNVGLLQGAAVQSTAVQWSCDLTKLTKLVEELETESITLASDMADDANDIINNTEACVTDFRSSLDLKTLGACVKGEVQSNVNNIKTTVHDYVKNVKSVANQISQQFKICITL